LYEKKEIYIHEQAKEEINGPLVEAEKTGGKLQILKNVTLQIDPERCFILSS
jgi:hypothetical protein